MGPLIRDRAVEQSELVRSCRRQRTLHTMEAYETRFTRFPRRIVGIDVGLDIQRDGRALEFEFRAIPNWAPGDSNTLHVLSARCAPRRSTSAGPPEAELSTTGRAEI